MVTVSEPRAWRQARSAELPWWPLAVVVMGYPLAWPLGLAPFLPIAGALLMAALLAARGGVVVLPGVTPFLVLAAWACPAVLALDGAGRLFGWGLRAATLASVAVALLYVTNARSASRERVVDALAVLWAATVLGGWLAVLFPDGGFTTPVGHLAPQGLLDNELVRTLLRPRFAETQEPWGVPEPLHRPAAPFPYANSWGVAMVLLTPVALAAMVRRRPVRWLLVGLLVAAVVPAVASSNRGMFLGFAASAAYVVVRQSLSRRVRGAVLSLVTVVILAVLTVALDLPARVSERQKYSTTTEGRASLYAETWERALQSPVLGWGAPRPSVVHEVAVGTQGQVWTMLFSFGMVGLTLFALALIGLLVRTWPRSEPTELLLLHATLVAAVSVVGFYGLDTMQWLTIALVGGVLLRDHHRQRASP